MKLLVIVLLRMSLWFDCRPQLVTIPFAADFCVIDHKDIYFDFLLGLKPIADNYHFIHPILRSLCRFTSVEKFDIIAPIAKNQAVEKNLCFINFIRPNKSSEENSIIELSNNKEVPSQDGKNKDLGNKDIKKFENLNKIENLRLMQKFQILI